MKTRYTYALSNIFLVLGRFDVSSWGEDGGVEFEPASDNVEITVGGDGTVVANYSANDVVLANITVLAGSQGAQALGQLTREQRVSVETNAIIPNINFFMQDPALGDEVADDQAFITQQPGPNKQGSVGELTWQLCLPNGKKFMDYASNAGLLP